jgi:hypothetical protein
LWCKSFPEARYSRLSVEADPQSTAAGLATSRCCDHVSRALRTSHRFRV